MFIFVVKNVIIGSIRMMILNWEEVLVDEIIV